MPLATPELRATASASSTISSREITRSPSVWIPTLHFTAHPVSRREDARTLPASRTLPGSRTLPAARTLPVSRTLPAYGRPPNDGRPARGSPLPDRTSSFSGFLAQLRQQRRELFQAAEVVAGQHQVGVLGRDHHPERARPEVRVVALVRVHPYQAVAQPGKPFHRRVQDGRVAPVKAVGTDDDDAAAGQAPAAVVPDEGVQGCADPGPALPVAHRAGGLRQRLVRASGSQFAGDAGEPGAEAEHLDL